MAADAGNVPIKIPIDLDARLEALAEAMTRDPDTLALLGRAGRVTKTAVLRYALTGALPELEARFLPRRRRPVT